MRRFLVVSLLSVLAFLPIRLAEAQLTVEAKTKFAKAHPGVRVYEQDGVPSMMYGRAFSVGSTPLESAWNHVNDWKDLYVKDAGELVAELKENGTAVQGVMYNPNTGEYKFSVLRFNQTVDGVPVFRSGVGFLVRNEKNNPVVMTGFDVKELNGYRLGKKAKTRPTVSDKMLANVYNLMESTADPHDHGPEEVDHSDHAHAQLTVEDIPTPAIPKQIPVKHDETSDQEYNEWMSVLVDVKGVTKPKQKFLAKSSKRMNTAIKAAMEFAFPTPIVVSDEKLVVWAGNRLVQGEPRLAVSFIAQRGSVQTIPDYHKFLVVADYETGEILLSENQIVGVDVFGNVRGRATDGLATLECDPEAYFNLPYAEVSIAGGNTRYADANGDYNIPHGGTAAVNVTSRLRGLYFEVFDQAAGNTIPSITQQVTPPGPANFSHNPNPNNDTSTANINAYLESNVCRDFVLSFEPTFPVINSQTFFDINTNINSTCNAFYDGSSINFYQAGNGCYNTASADVIYHEYGHHLVNVTGNGQGQFGEGSGDCVGVLMDDDPILGQGFQQNCSNGIRNANNTLQYPCSSSIHFCGQVLSGCVWSTRNELIVTEPNDYRDIGSALFFGMMIVRGQLQPGNSTIDPSITVMYLELDDDDGDIGNGTPHYNEIAAGFGAHNMDAPPLNLLGFDYPNGRPDMISPAGGVAFTVQVTDLAESHQSGTGQLHVDRGNGYETFNMNEISPGLYEANFPESDCATELKYYVSAETTNGNTQTDPGTAPDAFFAALSADNINVLFEDDFQTDKGWSVSGNVSDGQWGRGVPAGGGDRGDPPSDHDGSGACYVTDNADGNSDVDGGTTILTSPVFDATVGAGNIAMVRYSRWYNNVAGNAPEADIFVVEISNNGGSTWVNLETVGPTGSQVQGGWFKRAFKISDFVTPTNQMRVRFSASDLDAGSIVEAGVDAFEVLEIECAQNILADSVTMITGDVNSGDITDTEASDDDRIVLTPPDNIVRFIEGEFKAVSQTETPSMMKFTIESQTDETEAPVTQTVTIFNWETETFVKLNVEQISTTDSTKVYTVTGNLSDYVEPGTRCMKVRVGFNRDPSPDQDGKFEGRIDHLFWTVGS